MKQPWRWFLASIVGLLLLSSSVWAGPPFTTDDPEPVDFHHWEVYIASFQIQGADAKNGTLPHVEINNGPAPNLQIHAILPYAFASGSDGSTERGYGDTELGVKYRFLQESKTRPMAGVFPLLEVPTGNATRRLGTGHLQVFLPLWLQKSWGPWTTYGGGGYWINPGVGNQNYGLFGWLLQRDLSPHLTLGNELFYTTPSTVDGPSEFNFNFGGQYNFDGGHHLLFSAGRSISGDIHLMTYVAYQWTFGPREQREESGQPHAVPHKTGTSG